MQHHWIRLIVFSSITWISAWGQVNSLPPMSDAAGAAQTDTNDTGHLFPLDLAGYGSFQYLAAPGQFDAHSEFSGSIFVSKSLKRFRCHSEFNITNAGQYDSEGIHLVRLGPDWKLKLDSATLTYTVRDWLQVAAGFEFVPTYWRTHRYKS